MKKLRKVLALVLAMVMVLGMSTMTAFAAETGTIKITPPVNTPSTTTNTYKIYKVFDADGDGTNISYKLVAGKKTAPNGFTVDSAGNVKLTRTTGDPKKLTSEEIAAIANYVTDSDLVDTARSTGTNVAESIVLPNGYYYIATSTGTAVTVDSTNASVEVIDKNTVPVPTKVIDGVNTGSFDQSGKNAIAQVGSVVSYTATVTIEKGAKNYVFHDTMGTGLTYNDDVKVYKSSTIFNDTTEVVASNDTFSNTTASGDTITIGFVNNYIQGLDEGTVFTIKYSATVNSDALTVNYSNNTASISYGDNNSISKVPVDPKVYTGGISAVKYNGNNTETTEDDSALVGAGFKLKNSVGKYYKLVNNVVTWVDSEADGDEHVSAIDETSGKALVPEFTGLGSGTYTLVETTVPAGFNRAADTEITINAASSTAPTVAELHKTTDVFNNKGAELPSTGGMGTTLFYVFGAVLVIGAGIVLVARRRMAK